MIYTVLLRDPETEPYDPDAFFVGYTTAATAKGASIKMSHRFGIFTGEFYADDDPTDFIELVGAVPGKHSVLEAQRKLAPTDDFYDA